MADPRERIKLQLGALLRGTMAQLESLRGAVVRGGERGRRELDLTLLRRDRGRALRDLGEATAKLIEDGALDASGTLREPFTRLRDADLRMRAATEGTQYGDAVHESFLAGADDYRLPGVSPSIDDIFERAEPGVRSTEQVTSPDRPARKPAAARKKKAKKPAARGKARKRIARPRIEPPAGG